MKLKQNFVVILMLLGTSACATPGTPPIADSACVVFKPIGYAIPPMQENGTRELAEDSGNKYDTLETAVEVQGHNVRYAAVCP